MFREGGRFGYQGFGFGSFMFANIAAQILIYAVIAVLFIALGYGFIRLRRWSVKLSVALLRAWMAVGVPVAAVMLFMLAASKDVSVFGMIAAAVLLILSITALPLVLIRFFKKINAKKTPQGISVDALVVSAHSALCILYLSLLILLGGIFPLFGVFVTGTPGIILPGALIVFLLWLIRGHIALDRRAYIATLVVLGLIAVSTIITFSIHGYADILAVLAFPPAEMDMLGGIPISGVHIAIIVGCPLVAGWIAVFRSRKAFGTQIS